MLCLGCYQCGLLSERSAYNYSSPKLANNRNNEIVVYLIPLQTRVRGDARRKCKMLITEDSVERNFRIFAERKLLNNNKNHL